MKGRCERCGGEGLVAHVLFQHTIGLLIIQTHKAYGGVLCRGCAEVLFQKAQQTTRRFGWCSIMGLLDSPAVLAGNRRAKKQFDEDVVSPSTGAASEAFPWAPLMKLRVPTDANQIQVTLPVGIGVLAALTAIVSLFMGACLWFGAKVSARERMTLGLASVGTCFVSLAVLYICLRWHRRNHPKPGEIPDLLPELVPAPTIFQVRHVHLSAVMQQVGQSIRLLLFTENHSDGVSELNVNLDGAMTPGLVVKMAPREVRLSVISIPIPAHMPKTVAKFALEAKLASAAGKPLRHIARPVLLNRTRVDVVAVAMAFRGHVVISSDEEPGDGIVFMNQRGEIGLVAYADTTSGVFSPPPVWKSASLGSIDRPATEAVRQQVLVAVDQ